MLRWPHGRGIIMRRWDRPEPETSTAVGGDDVLGGVDRDAANAG
jgi:hypothetical protein